MTLRNQGRFKITIDTEHGKVPYMRTVLMPSTKKDAELLFQLEKVKSIAPLDCALGIAKIPFKMTPGFVSIASQIAVLANSYEDAVKKVLIQCNVNISSAELERVTDYVGAIVFEAQKKEAERAMTPEALKIDKRKRRRKENDRLYLMMDAAMIHYRDKPEIGDGWGECKCALCFHSKDIKYYKRKTDDEMAHKILKKDHMGFIGTAEEFIPHFLAFAQRNGCKVCSEVIIIVDGAPWIYKFLEKYFPYATIILDKWHAKENAWAFANHIHVKPELRKKTGEHLCELIDKGETAKILSELKKYEGKQLGKGIVNFHTYVSNHAKYMNYPEYEARGLFVGSGAMESSHRYSLQDRLKRPGMRWNREKAQGVVTLKKKYEAQKWFEVDELLEG